MTSGSGERERPPQDALLPERPLGLAGYWRIRATMPLTNGGIHTVVTMYRYPRALRTTSRPCSLHPGTDKPCGAGLSQPHTEGVVVTGTGTRQPTCCGRKPTAVGQSARTLPGNSWDSAGQTAFPLIGWQVRAANEAREGGAAIVVSAQESWVPGEGRQARELLCSLTGRRQSAKGTPISRKHR